MTGPFHIFELKGADIYKVLSIIKNKLKSSCQVSWL